MDLKRSFFSGITWKTFSNFAGQGMQTVTTIILARMLSPKEFGIIGIANIFILFANTINQLGISSAIVQRKTIDEGHLSTAFWINLVTGGVLTVSMIGLSYPAAAFFKNEMVQPVLTVLSFIFILGAVRIVQNAQFSRNLQFKKLAVNEVVELGSNSVMTLFLAWQGWAVWSLVWGRLFGVAMGAAMAWMQSHWRPKLMFRFEKFRELFRFGVHALAINILTYLGRNLDYILVGRFLGVEPLGVYTMAYNLVTLPQRKMSTVITSVAFPVFSRIQDDNERMARNYLNMLRYISFMTFPMLTGLAVLCPHFVEVVLSEKWKAAVVPMQIMCILGMHSSISTTIGSIFYAKGRPDIEFKADILHLIGLAAFVVVGIRYGINGVAVAVTLVSVIGKPIIFYVVSRLLKISLLDMYKAIAPAFVSSLAMAATIWLADQALITAGFSVVIRFFVLIAAGAGAYLAFQKIFRIRTLPEVYQLMMTMQAKRKVKVGV